MWYCKLAFTSTLNLWRLKDFSVLLNVIHWIISQVTVDRGKSKKKPVVNLLQIKLNSAKNMYCRKLYSVTAQNVFSLKTVEPFSRWVEACLRIRRFYSHAMFGMGFYKFQGRREAQKKKTPTRDSADILGQETEQLWIQGRNCSWTLLQPDT